ncbi:ABC transporter ATP-binding protein [Alteromonadaceae bacterium M269]|nr:ABC transporter ATP-binding protein [Alteromonadaceae bacterium M269]
MLSIQKLSKTYVDGTRALSDINLTLPKGMVGLLGPNGAGKSTLMRTLACIQPPDSGYVDFAGIDVLSEPMSLRKKLGYLPQYFGVYPNMSCLALLKHMAVLKGINDKSEQQKQIDSLLALTNLSDVANKKVSTFSGGMRQRFGIAQALLGDPELVIMDEPTAGLDPSERESLHSLLIHLSEQKLVLLSTHIVEDIENLCPHVAMINKGQIIQSAGVRGLIDKLDGKVWVTDETPSDDAIILSKSYQFGESCYRVYADEQPEPSAKPESASLQDCYFLELRRAQA